MTKGKPWKLILSFSLPVMFSQIFQQLYNTADSLIVGKILGTDALAAVSSSGNLIFFFVSFFVGTTMGAGVVIAKYFGADDTEKIGKAVHTVFALGLICGALLTLLGSFFTPAMLKLMKTDPEVLPQAIEYFRVYFFGSLPMTMYNVGCGIMNAVGDSRRPLVFLICASLFNIVLDLLFVGVFHLGVWSAALATVLSQLLSAILCISHLLKKGNVYSVDIKKIRLHREMTAEILKNGIPSGVQNSVIALANVIVQTQINSFAKYATAAYGAYAKIEGFAFLPINSFTMAISTFVSQNLGARQYDRAKKGARFGIITSVLLAETVGILFFIFAPQLISLFDSSTEVLSYGVTQARMISLFYFLLAFSHAVASVCRGAGKAFVPMLIMLSVWCVIRIIYILTVMHFFGDIRLVYLAYPITWSISSVIYLLYYLLSDWVHGFEK